KLLDSISEKVNGNGRIVHEMSSNGAVFNPGNINETPQFASLVWQVYRWNGDAAFLKKYFPTVQKGLQWLSTEKDSDKNGFPNGFGMMEVHGLDSEMIDVAAYTQKAYADASKMAAALGKDEIAETYAKKAKTLKHVINERFWSEDFQSYGDFLGTGAQALRLIGNAITRADTLKKPWSVSELKSLRAAILKNPSPQVRPFVLHHNWVVNTPMEVGLATPKKAKKALKTASKYTNPFGVFVTGIDRDETAGTSTGSFKGSQTFSYTGAVMTLPTGVLIVAENNYGDPNRALEYLQRMTRSFSYALPGSMYEVSPDYGMVTQAWNIYGYAVPIVTQFFGVQPNAGKKTVAIAPQMPSAWNEAALENVVVANNTVSVFYKKTGGKTSIKIEQAASGWELQFKFPKAENSTFKVVSGTGNPVEDDGFYRFSSTQKSFTVEITER
ncbi:MAG: glycogen debranching protein, partial [Marinirhabdus sp.]